MAFHLALIGFVYLLTWFFVKGLTALMASAGLHDFIMTNRSFHFVFGLVISIIVRKVMDR